MLKSITISDTYVDFSFEAPANFTSRIFLKRSNFKAVTSKDSEPFALRPSPLAFRLSPFALLHIHILYRTPYQNKVPAAYMCVNLSRPGTLVPQ